MLPLFSKILEKCIYNRLSEFLSENHILSNCQYGFRPKHSTSHAAIDLVSKVSDAFNSNKCLLGLFIDLSKAFDTLDHSILIDKLDKYGVRGVTKQLFTSYLMVQTICCS